MPPQGKIDLWRWRQSEGADVLEGIAEVRAELIDVYRKAYGPESVRGVIDFGGTGAGGGK